MNRTHLEHVLIALVLQVVLALATDNWWLGAAFAIGFFLGREHTQAETKARKEGARYPEIAVLYSPRYWTLDAVMDFVSPTVAVVVIALMME